MKQDPRTLRSQRHRRRLWYAADGVCPRCDMSLDPSHWHADHIMPWALTKNTNIHDLQSLCPRCNYEKGDTMLRKHQHDFDAICKDILAGIPIKQVIIRVTPGGGKSLLPVIAAHRLIPTVADALCWVVPRISLQLQGEQQFVDPHIARLVGHTHTIRAAGNDIDPCRSHHGYITTYNAVGADPRLHFDEFRRKRYILVLDEPHHIEENAAWHRALQPLIDKATLTIMMSGTWERGDGKRIAFLPYRSGDDGGYTPDFTPTNDVAVVTYSRGDALRERAIKPLRFFPLDCRAEWIDRDGLEQHVESLITSQSSVGDAIYTALNTDFAYQLLDRCVDDWQTLSAQRPRAKLLVVAANINRARDYLQHLQQRGLARVAIATSDDSEQAQEAITRFKRAAPAPSRIDVLVTVGMAYEGLDCPSITHVACLTHIRSRPWLEQMITRAARVDRQGGPYEEQLGMIFGPDDPLLVEVFRAIMAEQAAVVYEDRLAAPVVSSGSNGSRSLPIIPLASALTREREVDLATGEELDHAEMTRIQSLLRKNGLAGLVDPITWRRTMKEYQVAETTHDDTADEELMLTPRQRELQIRRRLEQFTREYDKRAVVPPGTMSAAIRRQFGKSREVMTEAELQQAWAWAQRNFPGV